ncbi:MAG: hypothetical protein ABIN91_19730 [Mucilaginibacter sp.]|uniref:hypothetical protein n=1 Tax=Mucilaginibacter sp. TaxID=1882438 RepID=UPI0032650558
MADHISFLAEQLLPQFIPKDPAATQLSFQFTMVPNKTYRVSYTKKQGVWAFTGYEEIAPERK